MNNEPRKCQADMYADPPRDCDSPFCGCNPEWQIALSAAQESGWLNSSEAGKLRVELAELRKPVSDPDADSILSTILYEIRCECPGWADVDVDTRNELTSKWRRLLARKPVAVEPVQCVEDLRQVHAAANPDQMHHGWQFAYDSIHTLLREYDALAQDMARANSAHDACMAEMRGLRERLAESDSEIQNLQVALAFWLPGVPSDDEEIAKRAGDDSFLLCGSDATILPCANQLGWLTLRRQVEAMSARLAEFEANAVSYERILGPYSYQAVADDLAAYEERERQLKQSVEILDLANEQLAEQSQDGSRRERQLREAAAKLLHFVDSYTKKSSARDKAADAMRDALAQTQEPNNGTV